MSLRARLLAASGLALLLSLAAGDTLALRCAARTVSLEVDSALETASQGVAAQAMKCPHDAAAVRRVVAVDKPTTFGSEALNDVFMSRTPSLSICARPSSVIQVGTLLTLSTRLCTVTMISSVFACFSMGTSSAPKVAVTMISLIPASIRNGNTAPLARRFRSAWCYRAWRRKRDQAARRRERLPERKRLARKSRIISRAALRPGIPVTPPPGCAPEPHR